LDDIEIVAKLIRDHSIEQVCYHNLGEPFLSKNILSEMKIMRKYNPLTRIYVSTNGIFLKGENKLNAALLFDEIFVSIDGSSQKTVETYQVGANFQKSFQNMRELVKYRDARSLTRPVIEWKYVVFEWNDSEEEINRAISMAKDAKVDRIAFCKGGMPGGRGESKFYGVSPFFTNLGQESWQGRVLVLRDVTQRQNSQTNQQQAHSIPIEIKTT
jgi:wyosine [tRNA(Phe)-imidazoG37] synthetase (radical SAM superfamily)